MSLENPLEVVENESESEFEVRRKFKIFNDKFKNYMIQYVKHKEVEIKLDVIKEGFKNQYNNQDQRLLKVDGIVVRSKSKKDFEIKEDIKDYLEDYGFLPLVVSVDKRIEQCFNLEKAKIFQKQSVRLYTGGKSIVDKETIAAKYKHFLECSLEELSNEFNKTSTEEKLEKAKLEELKAQLIPVLPSESVATQFGTLKLTDSYDYDMNIVFDGVSGKKEVFIKKDEDIYEVVIYPDEKTFHFPGEQQLGYGSVNEPFLNADGEKVFKTVKVPVTVENLYANFNNEYSSTFVKKRPYNSLIKEGFVFNRFEVDVDPFEFFRNCPVSKTKLNDLIQQGIIEEKDVDPYLELVKESDFIEVTTEGAIEQQASIFQQKLIERSENLRRRNDPNYVEHTGISTPLPNMDLTNFSF